MILWAKKLGVGQSDLYQMVKGEGVLDWPCQQCPARDDPMVNWHLMPWFGALGANPTDSSVEGYSDCYLVTVIVVVWFIYLKIVPCEFLALTTVPCHHLCAHHQ